jgi:hypothetical protein
MEVLKVKVDFKKHTKTKIEKNQKILKKLRQGVNISLKRQVRSTIFNVNMFFIQEDIYFPLKV